jgi:hypothetical protein
MIRPTAKRMNYYRTALNVADYDTRRPQYTEKVMQEKLQAWRTERKRNERH